MRVEEAEDVRGEASTASESWRVSDPCVLESIFSSEVLEFEWEEEGADMLGRSGWEEGRGGFEGFGGSFKTEECGGREAAMIDTYIERGISLSLSLSTEGLFTLSLPLRWLTSSGL